MGETIDTEIKGEPAGVRSLAADLRLVAAPTVSAVADALVDARRSAEDSWLSPAGSAFHSAVYDAIHPVDGLSTFLREAADGLELLAGELEQAQRQMADVRTEASAAGLTVSGFAIEHPGPATPAPGPLATNAGSAAVAEHNYLVRAHDAQNRKIKAFTRAAGEAAEVRTNEVNAASAWSDLVGDKHNRKLGFTPIGFGLDTAQGEAKLRGRKQLTRARDLSGLAKSMNAARPNLATLDERLALSKATRTIIGEAADAQKAWRSSTQIGQTMARASGVLAVGGVAYDIAVLDKPWHQAVVTGSASFGASVAAGAALGTLIPVPFLGTAIGAGVGAGVGIFTSGAIDHMFESKSFDVSDAVDAGWDELKGTVGLGTNAVTSTWKALF
ncbi:hypothetical protein [Dietzia alimentaria]|uniref:hypothetical protein n=1 Tax=Dietzia alimentaria TaxID=665550 RepID=UPI00029B1F18|nr:hypothetical protein [Dietzia alimentaria]